MEKHPITPGDLQPAQELLGDLLMVAGQPEEALEAYEESLAVWPQRYHSLLGAARAAEEAGLEEVAADYFHELVELTAEADP
jgi:tetratricopeptide (TPR) repeat protein